MAQRETYVFKVYQAENLEMKAHDVSFRLHDIKGSEKTKTLADEIVDWLNRTVRHMPLRVTIEPAPQKRRFNILTQVGGFQTKETADKFVEAATNWLAGAHGSKARIH